MKKFNIVNFIVFIIIFLFNGCIVMPQKQLTKKYNIDNLYYIDSLLKNNISSKNNDFFIIQRYLNPRTNNNIYYIIKNDRNFKIIRLCNKGVYCYNVQYLKSYYYLSDKIGLIFADTVIRLSNQISDDPYIDISGKINGKAFAYNVFYRQIINGSIIGEYILLFERDILNLLENDNEFIIQYPINDRLKLEKNIKFIMEECICN